MAEITPEQREQALKEFTADFVRNYPGPDTIIHNPEWHAPKIFSAALHSIKTALSAAPQPVVPDGDEDEKCPVCLEVLNPTDVCATEIELGICHAECLDGAAVVDLETGEPTEGPIDTYLFSETLSASPTPTASDGWMPDGNTMILINDLRKYAEKPIGSVRIDMNDVRSILAMFDALTAPPAGGDHDGNT